MADFLKGIDVSRWQDPAAISWAKVKAAGYGFVFVKVTDGSAYKRSFIDACLAHARAADSAGLMLGYYHFAHPSSLGGLETDAGDEAAFFLDTIKDFPRPTFPLVLDLEDDKSDLSPADMLRWVNLFQAALTKAGQTMILYSSKTYLDSHLPANHGLGEMPLWLAYYPRTFDPSQSLRIPSGWSNWTIWQYTENGSVPGMVGAVDISLMKPGLLRPLTREILAPFHAKRANRATGKQARKGSKKAKAQKKKTP